MMTSPSSRKAPRDRETARRTYYKGAVKIKGHLLERFECLVEPALDGQKIQCIEGYVSADGHVQRGDQELDYYDIRVYFARA
jgi:hypothetical protein